MIRLNEDLWFSVKGVSPSSLEWINNTTLEDLVASYKAGLIEFNYILIKLDRFIWRFSNKYKEYIPGFDKEDLYQELCMVLLKVIDRYDASRGIKFITMAHTYFDNHMKLLLRSTNSGKRKGIRLNESLDELLDSGITRNLATEQDFLSAHLATLPLEEEERLVINFILETEYVSDIARKLGRTRQSIYQIMKNLKPKLRFLLEV